MLSRLAAVAALSGAAVVATALPADAAIVQNCSTGRDTCYVTSPLTIPVGTPALGTVGFERSAYAGPELCNTGTGECQRTWVLLPGALVSVAGTTLASVTIPSFGVRSGTGSPTVYYGVPGVLADGTLDGAAGVSVAVPIVPLVTEESDCPRIVNPLEAVTFRNCYVTVAVEVL